MKNNTISKLTIKDDQIYLDDMKIKGVTGYEVKSSAPNKIAELTLKLVVSAVQLNGKNAQEEQVQEQCIISEIKDEHHCSVVKQLINSIMVELR